MRHSSQRVLNQYGLQLAVFITIVGILAITHPSLIGTSWLFATLENFSFVGLLAVGLGVTIIAGELDMSVASMATVAGVISIQLQDLGWVPSILIATCLGVSLGLFQGYIVHRLQISSLVLTIGTLIILRGVSYVLSGNAPVRANSFEASDFFLTRWVFVSPGILFAALVFLLVGIFLSISRLGRQIYAVGGARQEAIAAGVPVRRALLCSFAISAGCAALAGSMAAVKGASASPNPQGDILVAALSAVLIGGISLYGGRGTIWSVVLGVAIVSVLGAGLTGIGAPTHISALVSGGLLFALLLIDFARDARHKRMKGRAALVPRRGLPRLADA